MKILDKRSDITINISAEAIVRAVVIVIVTVLALHFLGRVHHQIELLFTAAFLALALNPAVSWLSRRLSIKSRVWATGLAYLVVLAFLATFLALVVPPLVNQTNSFVRTVPSTIRNLDDQNSTLAHFIQRYHLEPQINNLSHDLSRRVGDAPSIVISTAGRIGSLIISVITILVLTFMMLVEGPSWLNRLYRLSPKDKRDDYKRLANQMYRIVTGYVNGQVLIAAIASGFALVVLLIASTLTGTSINAVAMAGIVFLFGLIPLIGNTLAAVIVCLLCLFVSFPLALIMVVYFPIYQQIENATLQPHIQARNNQLTPLLVFAAALIGAGFYGLLGAFVAIPAAGCLRVLLEYRFGKQLAGQA